MVQPCTTFQFFDSVQYFDTGVRVDLAAVEAVLRAAPGVAEAAAKTWTLPAQRGRSAAPTAFHLKALVIEVHALFLQ